MRAGDIRDRTKGPGEAVLLFLGELAGIGQARGSRGWWQGNKNDNVRSGRKLVYSRGVENNFRKTLLKTTPEAPYWFWEQENYSNSNISRKECSW